MIVRVIDTSVSPEDVEGAKKLFREVVRPSFRELQGCLGIELEVRIDEQHGDLVEVAVISRWESVGAMESAADSADYKEALEEIRRLFKQTSIVRFFETVD